MTKIRAILDSALVPCGYRTVHIGEPYEVSAIQFLYKKTIDKLEAELIKFMQIENCEAYGEGQNDCNFELTGNGLPKEKIVDDYRNYPRNWQNLLVEEERDHFADSE